MATISERLRVINPYMKDASGDGPRAACIAMNRAADMIDALVAALEEIASGSMKDPAYRASAALAMARKGG